MESPVQIKERRNAWDGYIWGAFLELEENKRIVPSWRTSEFPEDAEDSRVEVLLEKPKGKTKLTLIHSNIPESQTESYRQGWEDFYFKPMREHFGGEPNVKFHL